MAKCWANIFFGDGNTSTGCAGQGKRIGREWADARAKYRIFPTSL
jgi:hypothetical protein